MNHRSVSADQHMFGGTVRVFSAEALLLPTGLITAAYLTRKLGPSDYGIFTLAATIVSWVEWSITSVFARATFKLVAEAKDWRLVGATVIRLHLVVSCFAALTLWLLSASLASLLKEPILATYLALFAIDIPVFSLSQAFRNILIGLGRFQQRAWIGAGRWIARLVFIILLVALGFSLKGAIVGSILASVIELIIAWIYLHPPFTHPARFPARQLWDYALPLFLFAISMRIYEKLDLVTLKALGGTAADAGIYGAAQNLSLVVNIFSLSFAPLLLSTLSGLLHQDQKEEARQIARKAMQLVIGLVPFAAMTAAASGEIVSFIFGKFFLTSAPILSFLIFGALSLAMISVATAILTAIGRAGLTFALTGPMVLLSLAGYFLMVPRFGAVGAAAVNFAIAMLGALVTTLSVQRLFSILPPIRTLVRSAVLSALTYALALLWPASGIFLVLKLTALCLFIVLGFAILGEFKVGDLMRVRAWSQQRWNAN